MQCPRCQHDNPTGVKFCGACGARLEVVCPACQTANPPANRYCHGCGQPLHTGLPPVSADPLPQSRATASAPQRPVDAERRQLTVMFCDIVESTRLSARLDPEVLRDVVRAYQELCGGVVERYHGHVAQYLGDGLLVYFGYPAVREDDARRAVRGGLDIIAEMVIQTRSKAARFFRGPGSETFRTRTR